MLREGLNALELENVGDTGAASLVFLNRFSVRYPRALVASGGTLEGRSRSRARRRSRALRPRACAPRHDRDSALAGGCIVHPNGPELPREAGRRYLATSVLQRPQVRKVQGSALRKTENQADYLLLAPKAFLDAAEPLLDLRRERGALGRRGFPSRTSTSSSGTGRPRGDQGVPGVRVPLVGGAVSVRYVLLLGDASYDPRDHLGTGVKDWLPGLPLKTSYLWTVSDPAYASVNGEDLFQTWR